jgi:predicted nucleic acid-binding protein
MKILDTNLWVPGTLRTTELAVELVAKLDQGETPSVIQHPKTS